MSASRPYLPFTAMQQISAKGGEQTFAASAKPGNHFVKLGINNLESSLQILMVTGHETP
jgi:hypothetical protein